VNPEKQSISFIRKLIHVQHSKSR